MTKVQNAIIGRARGSAGGMTFAKNYDKNVMRAKVFEAKNPKTAAQTVQRSFFAQVSSIVQTVSSEQMRSLFGNMPKAMSRRNALSKQVAAAYSVVDGQKVVDFSKLGAIGNGDKVDTNIYHVSIDDGGNVYNTLADKLFVSDLSTTNLIFVVFNVTKGMIQIVNTSLMADTNVDSSMLVDYLQADDEVYIYSTCAKGGGDVSAKAFGLFTIKVRKEDKSQNTAKDTPLSGDVVTLQSASIGASVSLDFSNYDRNNLIPGDLVQMSDGDETVLVAAADWVEGASNEWTSELAAAYVNTKATYLKIKQGNAFVDSVPFTVVVG